MAPVKEGMNSVDLFLARDRIAKLRAEATHDTLVRSCLAEAGRARIGLRTAGGRLGLRRPRPRYAHLPGTGSVKEVATS